MYAFVPVILSVLCAGLVSADPASFPQAAAALGEDRTIPVWVYDRHFEIEYRTENMLVTYVDTDASGPSLLLQARMGGDPGILYITLEREFFDSAYWIFDKNFTVTADGAAIPSKETDTTKTSRTLEIAVPKHTRDIEITGTVFAKYAKAEKPPQASRGLEGTIYYSEERVPMVPDRLTPSNALRAAIIAWEESNPGLDFVESDDPILEIKWNMYPNPTHVGLASCDYEGSVITGCTLEMSIGATSCDGGYIQADQPLLANRVMHELGHALGIEHTAERWHVMYSEDAPGGKLDTMGFVVPPRYDDIEDKLHTLETKIYEAIEEYERLGKLYAPYAGKTLYPDDYDRAVYLYTQLRDIDQSIKDITEEQKPLIDTLKSLGGYAC